MNDLTLPPSPAPSGAQPESRVKNAGAARRMISGRLTDPARQRRIEAAALIEAAFDRLPPEAGDDLERDGRDWCANVDWGGMASGIADAVETDYNLATMPETYLRLVAEKPRTGGAEALRTLERLDKETLDAWPRWLPELEKMLHNRRALGLGIFHFPIPGSWHFRSLHPCNLVTPPRAEISPESWGWYAMKTEFSLSHLLGLLETPKESRVLGWDLAEVKAAVEAFAKNQGKEINAGFIDDVEGFILGLSAEESAWCHEHATALDGWKLYVQEFTGKVTEHLLAHGEGGYLFTRHREEKMSDTIALFPLSLGQGFIDRVRGYGHQMLPFHDLENRVMNHACDVTMLASGLMLQAGQGDDFRRLRMETDFNGPVTFLPDGLSVMQQSFANPAGGVLSLRREFERMGNFRNRALGGVDHTQRENEASATAARLRWQESQGSRTNEVARFYLQLSNFHRIRWKRMVEGNKNAPGMEEVAEALKRAIEQGVTMEDVKNVKRVTARTVFGDGDPNAQFLAMMDMLPLMGKFPPSGQRVMLRMIGQAKLRDVDLVNEILGAEDATQDREFKQQVWRCQVEENSFETSATRVDHQDDDNHVVHGGHHTAFAEGAVEQGESGEITRVAAIGRIRRCMEHTDVHLAALAADRFSVEIYKDLTRRWANIINSLRRFEQMQADEEEAAQRQQLEEMRNPRPSVKDAETALTEQVKRQAALEELEFKKRLLREELDAKLAERAAKRQQEALENS